MWGKLTFTLSTLLPPTVPPGPPIGTDKGTFSVPYKEKHHCGKHRVHGGASNNAKHAFAQTRTHNETNVQTRTPRLRKGAHLRRQHCPVEFNECVHTANSKCAPHVRTTEDMESYTPCGTAISCAYVGTQNSNGGLILHYAAKFNRKQMSFASSQNVSRMTAVIPECMLPVMRRCRLPLSVEHSIGQCRI